MNKTSAATRGMENRKVYSPLPYYIIGAIWLISAFTIRMYRLSDFLILAAVSIVAYLLLLKVFPPKVIQVKAKVRPVMSGDKSADLILEEGRSYIRRLRELNDAIDDARLSAAMDRLEDLSNSIFAYIAKHPAKVQKIRRFVNYYLPSTVKMLETYDTMSRQGVRSDNIAQTMDRIEQVMDSMVKLYEKQLDNLFSDQAMDTHTDIDVLEGMFAQEGLGGSHFKTK